MSVTEITSPPSPRQEDISSILIEIFPDILLHRHGLWGHDFWRLGRHVWQKEGPFTPPMSSYFSLGFQALICLLVGTSLSGILTSLMPTFEWFIVGRVLNAFFVIGIFEVTFTYQLELVGGHRWKTVRNTINILTN